MSLSIIWSAILRGNFHLGFHLLALFTHFLGKAAAKLMTKMNLDFYLDFEESGFNSNICQ